jgi:RNA 2',3'-cyclic 3'-phosphodiesterase
MTTPDASVRLFLALWPPAEVQAELQRLAVAWSWPAAARRTAPEKLHVTLHFLGPVPAARLPELSESLAVRWNGCELLLDRAQVWPGGIAVLEAQQVPAPLTALHEALATRLRGLEIPVEERRYRPHVTFARKAFGATAPAHFEPVRWQVAPAFELVRSLPGGRGYAPLLRFG